MLPKGAGQRLLDVGCGRGGTANYLHQNGYSDIYGFDIDSESIEYAKTQYPHIDFRCCDALRCSDCYDCCFDIIYLFNVLYSFNDGGKETCLRQLRKLADDRTRLVIFDYTELQDEERDVPTNRANWHPLNISRIRAICEATGWRVTEFVDYTPEYCGWYADLVDRILRYREDILEIADEHWYSSAKSLYEGLLSDLVSGRLGGGTLYLQPGSLS